jgi:uncharacterized protein YbcI
MTDLDARLAGEISNAVTHHYRSRTGHGPTDTRTSVSDGMVVVTLEGMLSEAESYLVRTGKAESVDSARRALHTALRRELVPLMEQLTGRRVTALMGDHDLDLDVAVHIFLLDSTHD